jgi:hypothetical protein
MRSWMTIGRLFSCGMVLFAVAEVLADGGADLHPVVRGHRGGGAGLDAFEGEGFEAILAIAIGLDQGLDIIARGGVVTGFDLDLEVGGEVFGESDGEGVHGSLGGFYNESLGGV